MRTIWLVAVLALAGCASSSDVYQVAPGSYRVSASASFARGGESTAKAMAIRSANQACAKQGRTAIITDEDFGDGFPSSAQVSFRCSK